MIGLDVTLYHCDVDAVVAAIITHATYTNLVTADQTITDLGYILREYYAEFSLANPFALRAELVFTLASRRKTATFTLNAASLINSD